MIFSTAELSFASCRNSVLIRIDLLGKRSSDHLSSARALQVDFSFLNIAIVSKSVSKGKSFTLDIINIKVSNSIHII